MQLKESRVLELKSTLPQKKQIVKTCVAFANTAGGEIIIGVEDATGKVLGVTDKVRDKIFEEVSNSIFDSISPTLIPEIFEKNINGKSIVIVKIFPGNTPPYFIKSEGSKKGVYLRVGTSTRKASEEYIEDLYRQQKNRHFDEEVTNLPIEKLNKEMLSEIYGRRKDKNIYVSDKVVARSDRNPKKLLATNAGVLFFTERPAEHIPESIIICTHFKGKRGRDIIRTTEIEGPIPVLVSSALKLLEAWLEKNFQIEKKGSMKGQLPIPLEALREGIINALVHRKYFIPGAVKIAIFDDRVEIFSPGSLPGLLTIDSLGDGTTFLRNPTIAKLARRFKLVEKLGSGVRLIFESCKKAKLRKPIYNEDGDFVKLTFSFEEELNPELSDEEKIIKLAEGDRKIKIKDLVEHLGYSRNTSTRRMNDLIERGIFLRKGKGPGTYFILKGNKNGKNHKN